MKTLARCIQSFILITLLACSSSSTQSFRSSVSGPDLDVTEFKLDNGLKLLVYENHRLPVFSYYTFFEVGGRHELKGFTGSSHFLEHLMFKGAKKYGPGIFDTTIEGSGGNTNAYTSFDSTVYYENLPSKMIEKIMDMEADRMNNLLLVKDAFESERQVVLEERKYRYENNPQGKLYLKMMKAVFENTPYGGSVIGSEKDLLNIKRKDVRKYFKQFYAPNNAIIVVAGDVDPQEVYKFAKEYYGPLKKSEEFERVKAKRDRPELYKHRGRYNRWVKIHGQSPTPLFALAYKGEPLGTRKSFVMDIISSILGDGESSYLHQKYVASRNPKLQSVSVGNYTLKYNGVFFVMGELLRGTNLTKMKSSLLREARRMCSRAITERSLQKTKNQYMINYYRDIQSNAGVAHFLGNREHFYGDYEFYKKEIEIYNSVTVDEAKRICEDTLKSDEFIFLSLWNRHAQGK